ncbi:MAG: hypothetical protein NDJ90_09940 [Oligoflexia bacterium]|nr:hypothetical protein [Oligoflexia bacterium]
MLSIRTHNILDYVIGVFLFFCPALFGFAGIDAARNTFVALGVGLVAYSLLTDYRYSIVKLIPLSIHMGLDVAIGVALLLAPSVFGYRESLTNTQNWLHIVMGLGAFALVIFTRPTRGTLGATTAYEDSSRYKRAA